jgi:trimethylamine--corrinoid protein Co-methyltransferase
MKISVLTGQEIDRIKTATERLIEDMGFKVLDARLRQKAARVGAIVDEQEQTVRIPAELLRELLSTAPHSYIIRGVNGTEYVVGGGQQYVGAIVTDPWIMDYETRKPRRPSLNDVRTNTILTQRNPKAAQVSRMDFPVTEYDDATSSLRALEVHLLNHAKHYSVYAGSIEGYRQWMDIGNLIAPDGQLKGSGLMSVAVAIVSPMVLTDINAELLMSATDNGFAVLPTICPMTGTTSPYNKVATLLQGNVENIFLAAMTQLLNPGNPFLYLFGPSVSDMRSAQSLYYTMDKALWKVAAAELAKSYSIPVGSECGGTLSPRYDMQSGAESMMFMTLAQNVGSDLLSGLGSCYNANGLSSEMIVIQSAWLEAAEYLRRGIDFDYFDEGIQSIREQGHGGNFLMDNLTLQLMGGNEFFTSDLFDMSGGYEPDALSMLEKAHKKVGELTADYLSPVPGHVQEKLRRYFHDLYNKL